MGKVMASERNIPKEVRGVLSEIDDYNEYFEIGLGIMDKLNLLRQRLLKWSDKTILHHSINSQEITKSKKNFAVFLKNILSGPDYILEKLKGEDGEKTAGYWAFNILVAMPIKIFIQIPYILIDKFSSFFNGNKLVSFAFGIALGALAITIAVTSGASIPILALTGVIATYPVYKLIRKLTYETVKGSEKAKSLQEHNLLKEYYKYKVVGLKQEQSSTQANEANINQGKEEKKEYKSTRQKLWSSAKYGLMIMVPFTILLTLVLLKAAFAAGIIATLGVPAIVVMAIAFVVVGLGAIDMYMDDKALGKMQYQNERLKEQFFGKDEIDIKTLKDQVKDAKAEYIAVKILGNQAQEVSKLAEAIKEHIKIPEENTSKKASFGKAIDPIHQTKNVAISFANDVKSLFTQTSKKDEADVKIYEVEGKNNIKFVILSNPKQILQIDLEEVVVKDVTKKRKEPEVEFLLANKKYISSHSPIADLLTEDWKLSKQEQLEDAKVDPIKAKSVISEAEQALTGSKSEKESAVMRIERKLRDHDSRGQG